MRKLNYATGILLLLLTLGLNACGDDVYYTDDYLRNSDEKLCSGIWVEKYDVANGVETGYCRHVLTFATDMSGKEEFYYYTTDDPQPIRSETFYFTWAWADAAMEGLMLKYGARDTQTFGNVWVRENYLSGEFRGMEVTFVKQ